MTDNEWLHCMQNRELSWLRFNERVLEEANNIDMPLFERFFFLSVFTSNLSEFFMVRVGGFQNIVITGQNPIDNKTDMTASEILDKVFVAVALLYPARDSAYEKLESEFSREDIKRLKIKDLDDNRKKILDNYYLTQVEPLLAPQIVDKTHPFPNLENKRLIVAVFLESKNSGDVTFGMIPLPRGVDRLYFVKDGHYILLEDILIHYCAQVFKKYLITEKAVICVTRNADIDTVEDKATADGDFRDHISNLLKKQKRLAPVCLEIQGMECDKLATFLQKKLSLSSAQVFYTVAPIDLSYQSDLRDKTPADHLNGLCFPAFEPAINPPPTPTGNMFKRIRQGDILLSHPFESLQPFLSMVREAADDKHVISIQITLYRLAGQSRLAETLIAAAENGKDVFVFIELRARMDEGNNIDWAKRLEEAGCTVFYGHEGYKMHAKICLITRKEAGRQEFFTHIGTGNYNEKTAKLYTDLALITANRDIATDAVRFFHNMMTGTLDDVYSILWVAPRGFKTKLIEYIERETKLGEQGFIVIKCNSLTDKDVIWALIHASQAGTHVELIVRGICCILPGVEPYTNNIHVRSIVGRFLEHSRIYKFGSGNDCDLIIGSGDMMTRNTQRRVELFVPILDKTLRERIFGMLDIMMKDNIGARLLTTNGRYIHLPVGDEAFDSQQYFMKRASDPPENTSNVPHIQIPHIVPDRLFERIVSKLRGLWH